MKKKLLCLALTPLLMLGISSCGGKSKGSEPDPVFTKDDYGPTLLGKFYTKNGTLEVNETNAVYKDGSKTITLTPKSIEKGNNSLYTINYVDKDTKDTYVFELNSKKHDFIDDDTGEIYDTFTYYVPTLLKNETTAIEFMPDISRYQGGYTSDGTCASSNNIFTIDNDYDASVNGFEMGIGSGGYYGTEYSSSMYIQSYFHLTNDEWVIGGDFIYYDGDEYFDSFYITVEEEDDKVTYNINDTSDYPWLVSAPTAPFGIEYFDKDNTDLNSGYALSFYYDEDEGTVTSDWDTYLEVKEVYGDDGFYVMVDGTKLVLKNDYAIYGEEKLFSADYYMFSSITDYTYQCDGYSICLTTNEDWEYVVMINEVEASEAYYALFEGTDFCIQAKDNDGNVYQFAPYTDNIVVAFKNDVKSYLFDYDSLVWDYCLDLFDSKLNEVYIDSELNVTFGGESYEGKFAYEDGDLAVSVAFDKYQIGALTNGIYYLYDSSIDGDAAYSYLFDQYSIFNAAIEYTSNGQDNLKIDDFDYSLIIDDKAYEYVLEAFYVDYNLYIGFVTTVNDEEHGYVIDGNSLADFIIENDNLFDNKSYVSVDTFNLLVGSYAYEGQYGTERFVLTSDGKFTADTLNSTKDALIKDVEYDYYIYEDEDGNINLNFLYDNGNQIIEIPLVYTNGYFTVSGYQYYNEDIIALNGVYYGSGYVVTANNGEVYINGKEVDYIGLDGDLLCFMGDSLDDTYSIVKVGGRLIVNNIIVGSFNDYSVFECYEIVTGQDEGAVLDIDYDIEDNSLSINLIHTSGTTPITDYSFTYYNDAIALKFTDNYIDYYVVYKDDSITVVSENGSIPAPPPLPF